MTSLKRHPILLIFTILATLSCANEAAGPSQSETSAYQDAALTRSPKPLALMDSAAPPPAPGQATSPTQQQPGAQSMIIRTGQASLEVDSLEPAIDAVRALATRVGGYIAGSAIQGGKDRLRSASLELKVPAARWSDVVQGLSPIGKLESVTEDAQDVGEEFVDVNARLTNARRLESRLSALLEQRTGKLEDVLAVERELARVREEIERFEGRIRYLQSRVAVSTLAVHLHEPMPIVGGPGENVLVDAFRQSWTNFVQFLAWLIAASGVLIPLGILTGLGFLLVRRLLAGWPRPKKSE